MIQLNIQNKKLVKKNIVSSFPLLIIIVINLIIEFIQIVYDFPITTLMFFYNIQIFVLLYSSYKFLLKGFIVSTFFNFISGINFYIQYLTDPKFLYVEMVYFRVITIILSSLIYLLSVRHKSFVKTHENSIYIDSLTELFNHRYFYERLDQEVKKAQRMNSKLGLVMIDIDHFRKLNDNYGHKEGDLFLKNTADVLRTVSRSQDIISRYEADIFAILLPDLNQNEITSLIGKIESQFSSFSKMYSEKKGFNPSISIGYSLYPDLAINGNELISQVESALYKAKQTGRNNVKIYKDIFDNIIEYFESTESQLLISLKTLLSAVSAKDRYTLGHSERVMDYAVLLGKAMNLNDEDLKELKIAALVHDVGKIEIPQQILNKTERLSDEEFELIKKHPIYSAEIVKPISSLNKIYDIVKHHHERVDGRGYPDGIKGDNILLEARILTIADSFDAMMSNRPYRNPLSLEEAKKELLKNAGSQFDANIAKLFIDLLESGDYNERIF